MPYNQTPLKPGSHPTDVILDNGKKVVNNYDAIGRIASKALKNGNSTILNTEVTYYLGADGSKTALVKTYKNGSDIEYRYLINVFDWLTQVFGG